MIINSKGEIVESNAMWPSDGEKLFNQLKKLLNLSCANKSANSILTSFARSVGAHANKVLRQIENEIIGGNEGKSYS